MNSSDSGRPLRDARFVSRRSTCVQIPRVVQLRQVVGDRQRLGALHAQRVVERDRARFNPGKQRRHRRGIELRCRLRRHPVDRDQRTHRPPPAGERKTQRRDLGLVGNAAILPHARGRKHLAGAHHPAADGMGAGVERRRQPVRGHRPRVPPAVHRQDEPGGRGYPLGGLRQQGLRHLLGLEARVHRADHVS